MANKTMRDIRPGEVPFDGGTAIQEDAGRPVVRGNGPDDYLCVVCGNLLAEGMHPAQMTIKFRVRCGKCSTVNVAVTEPPVDGRFESSRARSSLPANAGFPADRASGVAGAWYRTPGVDAVGSREAGQ